MKYFKVKFVYRGEIVETFVKSLDMYEALQAFKREHSGGQLIDISETSMPLEVRFKYFIDLMKEKIFRKKIKLPAYISALRQLGTLLKAGLPLKESLEEISNNSDDAIVKRIFKEAELSIDSGGKLSDVFAKYEIYIGPVSYAMFKLGEETGELAEIVDSLAKIYDNVYQNVKKVKKALRYPIITLLAIIGAFIFLVTVVVPKFRNIFDQLHADLPLPTKILLWTETAFRNYGLYILFFLIISIFVLIYLYKTDYNVKRKIDGILLKMYIVNKLVYLGNMARFFDVLAKLLNSGIPANEALKISEDVVTNEVLKEKLSIVLTTVEQGKSLTQGFIDAGVLDNMSLKMIDSGEKSGNLEVMFQNVSRYYEDRLQDIIDNMQSLIEPVIMAVIGGMVLLIALGIFMPMWNMATAIQGGK